MQSLPAFPPRKKHFGWIRSFACALAIFAASPFAAAVTTIQPIPHIPLDQALNEQVLMVPVFSGGQRVALETTVFQPPGNGPFPVLVMNHGKAMGDPRDQGRDRFVVVAREFVRRGYAVVVPMRKGFSRSTGLYAERGCNMTANGLTQAEDLFGVLEYLRRQPWADASRVVVAGQSYGGLTALAFGSRNVPGVRGLINFAGGLKVHGGSCRWDDALVQAFSRYGAYSNIPSLWFYGANDQHFSPALAQRMHAAYTRAGGRAQLVAFDAFKNDAHGMIGSRDGVRIWWPETERFLKSIGMPTQSVVVLADDNRFPETGYASVENLEAIPFERDQARQQYQTFLGKTYPRAFAFSQTGAWSWAEEGDDPASQALADCQKNSSAPCQLYAVDGKVVWAPEVAPVMAEAAPPPTEDAAIDNVTQTATGAGQQAQRVAGN